MSIQHRYSTDSRESYEGLEPQLAELALLPAGDPRRARLRGDIIAAALPLGSHIASRYGGRGADPEDLEQVAAVGVVLAVDRFDPGRGSTFIGFAIPTIMGEVKRYFRDSTWAVRVPRPIKDLQQRVTAVTPELTQRLRREPTARELALELDAELGDIVQALIATSGYTADPLDAAWENEDDDRPAPQVKALTCSEPGYELTEDALAAGPLLAELSEQERAILVLRYGHHKTQRQIGQALGVSQMQTSRILARLLEHLREQAAAQAA